MALAADSSSSSSATHSPRSTRTSTRNLASPWSHVVRGESDAIPAAPPSPSSLIPVPDLSDRSSPKPVENLAPSSSDAAAPSESPDHGFNGNAAASPGKKPAWNKPSNGAIEVGAVMGAVSWPPLSESTRASPKSSAADSLKALPDGAVSVPTGPVIPSPPPKPTTSNPSPNSTPNHATPPARQKSMKRGGGGGGSSSSMSATLANGGPVPPSPQRTSVEMPQVTLDKQAPSEPSPKDLPSKNNNNSNNNNWDHGSRGSGYMPQTYGGNDHHRNYGGNRRGNNNSGSQSHHHTFGNRRGDEWNRNFSNRDVHTQQQRGVPRPYFRPPAPAPFITPTPQVRPFANPIGFSDMPSMYYVPAHPSPETLRGVPFVAHAAPPAMFFPAPDPQRALLLKQIDYYFSNENLCKDIFLRQNMDDQGWVLISLIAGFNRVRQLTNSIPYIMDVVRASTLVEVQGEKIRRRNDWMNWRLPPPPNQFGTASGPQSPAMPNYETLVGRMQRVVIEGVTNQNSMRGPTRTEAALSRSSSGEFKNQSQVVGEPNAEGNGQVFAHSSSNRSTSARSLGRSDTF